MDNVLCIEPTVIEYLKNPPDRATLVDLIQRAGLQVRGAVREERHAVPGARPGRSRDNGRATDRRDARAPDSHQPALRRHAGRCPSVPSV
jgi:arsenate reductase-like glutaredoxin family protein